MHLVIAKVDEVYFDGDAVSVTLPTTGGELTVLPEHMPLITTLKEGAITVRTGSEVFSYEIQGGVLEVTGEKTTVIL